MNCRRIRLNDRIQTKLPEVDEPRQKSTYTKGQNKQRHEDKKERRRAKRQRRRANNKTKSPEMSTDRADFPSSEAVAETSLQYTSKQEVLETITA